eukprot:CAMPEP_0173207238 /NCGR_PEP_ID=MMETSP1141-20130122/21820_1 /TAXON_ID=483371 /ORGANISM="non described non described, Strain CCMP2298" /LENGTH=118 /DNA_ID=CAMNT_0014133497 /DNA_START=59 /DNA_END=415 /DNA_ORIENTATION=-
MASRSSTQGQRRQGRAASRAVSCSLSAIRRLLTSSNPAPAPAPVTVPVPVPLVPLALADATVSLLGSRAGRVSTSPPCTSLSSTRKTLESSSRIPLSSAGAGAVGAACACACAYACRA